MTIEELNKIPHEQICDRAKDKFIAIYDQKFGEGGETFFEQQKAYFLNQLLNGPFKNKLKLASTLSIHDAFMLLAIEGLSLEPGAGAYCYLMCDTFQDKATQQWVQTAKISVTGYGEIFRRQRAGQISHCDKPVIVYDCDDFAVGEENGHKFVKWLKCMNRPASARIIGAYMRIVRKDNDVDYAVMDMDEVNRLENYSRRFLGGQNSNALYHSNNGQIDPGFLIAKLCKHAFKTYSKLPIGTAAVLVSEMDIQERPAEKAFGEQPMQGVKVETDDDDPF